MATATRTLMRTYYGGLLPAAAGVLLILALRGAGLAAYRPAGLWPALPGGVLTLAVAAAAALPVLLRSAFARRVGALRRVAEDEWLRFERRIFRVDADGEPAK